MYVNRIRDLTGIPKSLATYLYKELTGDETAEENSSAAERQALIDKQLALSNTFVCACGEPEILADLRSISNAERKGSSCFSEFWQCMQEELDAMTVAADERRHSGVVAYLSEIISHARLFEKVVVRFEQKKASSAIPDTARIPSQRWFEFQFWPANEHVRSALQFTGRFPLKLQLQVRNLRKEHAHAHYCAKQKKLVQEWVHKFREYATAGQPDDKANGTIGEPGTATAFLSRQRAALSSIGNPGMRAMDHDAGSSKMRLIPSVFLKQQIPEQLDGSWLRGQASIV